MNDQDETVLMPEEPSEDEQTGRNGEPAAAGGDAPPGPAPADAAATETAPGGGVAATADASSPVSAEQSGIYNFPEPETAPNNRLRLVPPDGKPLPWWIRHRRSISLTELLLAAVCFLLTLYILGLWLFPSRDWKVAAKPGRWRKIVVHHTATKGGTAEAIDRYHRENNKWENGLGYHFVIGNGRPGSDGKATPDGFVFVGNRWIQQLDGAHIRKMKGESANANSFSIGIALVGDFENADPTAKQVAALRKLLTFLMEEYSISPRNVVGHGEAAATVTLCPGKRFPLRQIVDGLTPAQ